jgi:hypothetical protein
MNTGDDLNIDGFLDNIIASYENRIQKIQEALQSSENITNSSNILFDNVQNSLAALKSERDKLNTRLCETLAKNGSLRKKDYHNMMSGILDMVNEKEEEAGGQFLNFIESQKKITQSLKNSLLSIKDISSQDANEKIEIIKKQLSISSALYEEGKKKAIKTFSDLQQMHNKLTECLEGLLKKGNNILIQDIKELSIKLKKESINSQQI